MVNVYIKKEWYDKLTMLSEFLGCPMASIVSESVYCDETLNDLFNRVAQYYGKQ